MYNKNEVETMFNKVKVLIGSIDVAPEYAVKDLFGEDAVTFARHLCRGEDVLGYGIGDYTADYLTYKGFQTAATFVNVKEIKEIEAYRQCEKSK